MLQFWICYSIPSAFRNASSLVLLSLRYNVVPVHIPAVHLLCSVCNRTAATFCSISLNTCSLPSSPIFSFDTCGIADSRSDYLEAFIACGSVYPDASDFFTIRPRFF
jgi:hypothetical protein